MKGRETAVLAGALALWVLMLLAALQSDSAAGHWLAEIGSLVLIVVLGVLWRRGQRFAQRWRAALDAMRAGVVLYGPDDRLLVANADFRRLYDRPGMAFAEGMPFEELLRTRVRAGLVPEADGREETWIAERMAQHRTATDASFLRQMADGRWRRITEQRLPDGSLLGFSIDVTELIDQQRALDSARQDAERAHQLLNDAVEAMPAAVEIYDRDDRLVLFNQRLVRLYPHMAGRDLIGETFGALLRKAVMQGHVPEAIGREQAWLDERLALRGRSSMPRTQRAPDGSWIHIYETPVPGGGLVAVRLDATEIVNQREELKTARQAADASRTALVDAIEALPEGFALYDADDRLVLCNERYRELYSATAPAMTPGTTFEQILRYGLERGQYPQAAADPETWLAERVRRHREPTGEPILQELPGNRWLRIDERRTRDGGIAGVRTDVSELVSTRHELERLSSTDALTGLANRRRFDAALADEIQRAHRHGTPLALLLVDVDHFKLYNDHHGHPEGDRALRAVAAVLAQQARRPGELVARYGGEEFALLLPHADGHTAKALAERCRVAMATLALPHGQSPTSSHVTVSIGAALHDTSAREGAESLLRRADAALYAAKAAGRARCVMADDEATA
jgi:diguanylate cyclase (GGDEF)-like protein